MVNNTKKIRRSKSRYGRTRRQRRKQRRMRGGFAFGDLINVFKPKTQEEKCTEAQQEAEKICNKPVLEEEQGLEPVVEEEQQEEPVLKPAPFVSDSLDQEQSFSPPLSPSPSPLDDGQQLPSLPLNDEFSSLPLEQQQQDQQLPLIATTLPPSPPSLSPSTSPVGVKRATQFGGSKKSKKNKKQNRRKKMKTRRNKK
jgi:hypothetical protein